MDTFWEIAGKKRVDEKWWRELRGKRAREGEENRGMS